MSARRPPVSGGHVEPADPSGSAIGRRQAGGVGLSALYAAAVSYLVLVAAAHTLSSHDNALFLAYWALLFGTYGVLSGASPESSRATFDGEAALRTGRRPGVRIVALALAFGAVVCLVLAATGVFWASRVLGGHDAWLVAVVACAGTAFSGYLSVSGVLSARTQWRGVILITTAEATIRLLCVAVAVVAFDSLAGLAVGSAVSALCWVPLLARRDVRGALTARSDSGARRQVGHFVHACVASASSAGLVVGFPVLIRLTSSSAEFLSSAGLLLAITLTRAPLLVPLTAYQGVAVTYFLRNRRRGLSALVTISGVVLSVTAVAAAAAWLLGPWLFTLLLGDRYAVGGGLLAGLTVGAGMLAVLTVTGTCCLALGGHRSFALGWVASVVAAVLLLLLPTSLEVRVVVTLVGAPLVGISVHLESIRRHVARGATPRSALA